ncbi:glycosyltransferase [Hymenobacter edaphi]|uniref:Glycosyltransferase 2-like domain-containing protein n=1 Tax=Hymenobacter edaphi TaxID=2211146 RepID=A0A328BDX6_9BACT|nr:glycosyltransferase [Hymenobacter edaphi]RAK64641.1 hypothetical protein DLM85_18310 [Hymenobacter edaphi]
MSAALALVLPCYNPPAEWAANVLSSLQRLQQTLPAGTTVHLYLVNDGSTRGVSDADLQLLRAALPAEAFTYLSYPANRGKGHALRTGVQQVQEPLCLFTDIDFPYEETSMATLYQALHSQRCDLAVGVRDDAYYAQVPAARRRVSRLLRRLTRTLLRLPIDDTQCGLKGFNAKGRALFLQTTTDRYLFDLELLLLASRQPAVRTEPVPVALKPGVVLSPLNVRVLLTESRNLLRLLGR